jgi:hypothetical protein
MFACPLSIVLPRWLKQPVTPIMPIIAVAPRIAALCFITTSPIRIAFVPDLYASGTERMCQLKNPSFPPQVSPSDLGFDPHIPLSASS